MHNNKTIKGSTLLEYIMIVGFIAATTLFALSSVQTGVASLFNNLNTTITSSKSHL